VTNFAIKARRVQFLFGSEVVGYVDKTALAISSLHVAYANGRVDLDAENGARRLEIERDSLPVLARFYEDFAQIVAPYVKADMKLRWQLPSRIEAVSAVRRQLTGIGLLKHRDDPEGAN
jgi:hypothetical protein